MKYSEWLPTLTHAQLAALASQSGITLAGWRNAEVPKLRQQLLGNSAAKQIFRENYGKDADIQN